MAFLLRSPKFIFNGLKIIQKANLTHLQNEINQSYFRRLPLLNNVVCRKFSEPRTKEDISLHLEKSISQLDLDDRHKQKIIERDIKEIFAAIKQWGSITYQQSLLLLKCCGSLSLFVLPSQRTELIKEAMSLIQESGVEIDIAHYNTLLNAYFQNEHKFSVAEFLEDLGKKKIQPNKVTYQRLLKACCQRGDIVAASEILETMKKSGMSISEDVFNSLIYGHGQVGDMTNASAILNIMKKKGIEPSSETYLYLLCGYAKAGDINEIRKIMSSCEEKEIMFMDRDIFEIIYVLGINGHFNFLDEMFEKLKKQYAYHSTARLYAIKFLQKNLDFIALKIHKTTAEKSDFPNEKNNGKYLIDFFVRYRSVKELLDFCKKLEEENLSYTPLSFAIKETLQLGNIKKAISLFSLMEQYKHPLRPHYFWPLMVVAADNGNNELLKIVTEMKNLNVKPCSLTLYKFLFRLYKLGDNLDVDMEKMQKAGLSPSVVNYELCIKLMAEGKFDEAKYIASSFPLNIRSDGRIIRFCSQLVSSIDPEFVADMLYVALHDIRGNSLDTTETAFDADLEAVKKNESDVSPQTIILKVLIKKIIKFWNEDIVLLFLKKLLDKKIAIDPELADVIRTTIRTDGIEEILSKLTDANLKFEMDEIILLNLSKNQSIYNQNSDFLKELDEVINFARQGDTEMVLKKCNSIYDSFQGKGRGKYFVREEKTFKTLLMILSSSGNFDLTKEVWDIGIKLEIIGTKNFYPLVKTLVVKGDLSKATELFCDMTKKTNCKSSWFPFMTKLIEANDLESLQKVIDTLSEIVEEQIALAMLLSVFAHSEKANDIQKLLNSKDYLVPQRSISYACDVLLDNKSLKGFNVLLTVTKHLGHIDRHKIYTHLLELCIDLNDSATAKTLSLRMEEDNIVPTSEFLNSLNVFLQNE